MKSTQLVFFLLGILGELIAGGSALQVKENAGRNGRGRMLSRGRRVTSPSLSHPRTLPSRVAYDQYKLEKSMLGSDGSDFISDATIGGIIKNKNIISKAPSRSKIKPMRVLTQPEGADSKAKVVQKTVQRRGGKISSVVRSISPRRINVVNLDMGPQEMVNVLSQEARRMEQDKMGINKGSAELACGRYNFMFHCEVVEIPKDVLAKRKDKYLYTVRDSKDRIFAWNTAQGTYGRVVFGFIEVPSVDQRFRTGSSMFSEFYKLPETLTGVKVLFHGGGKYPAKYLLPGMKVSVAIKSYFRGLFKIGRVVWNREREILYSLSKEFWTDGHGGPLTHTPTVFSVHYQDPLSGKQKVLFEDQENRRALVSELLIMERITGQTFFEVLVYLQDSRIFEWLEKTNAWELWYKAIYKLQWTLNHIMQSFMTTGYVLYMHCDLNRSNILLSIPPLTLDHKRNLLNIISMDPWDVRLIDLSFVWVPGALKSRNTRSICSQVNKAAIFSDANYLYVCIIELLKTPQKDLPITKPSPLYKTVRAKALELWERLEAINEWWAVGVNFIGRNSSTHTRYKIRNPELGGNTFNECIEGMMLMSDVFDSEAKRLGIRLPFNSFSPEAYLRGYLHLSFRISRLGLCLRTKIIEHWESVKKLIVPVSYFDFSVMVLSLDASISSDSCRISLPKSERVSSPETASSQKNLQGSYYTMVTLPSNICQEIKLCMASVEAMKSIPGDDVIKPAISVVTAENHESDSIVLELRREKRLPESIQALGVRLFGRFQGIIENVNLSKDQLISFLVQLDTAAKTGAARTSNPSEGSLQSACNVLERNETLKSLFGAQTYSSLISYAANYRLNSFCQLLFKQLRNTMLFSDHLDPSYGSGLGYLTTEKVTTTTLPSRSRHKLDISGGSSGFTDQTRMLGKEESRDRLQPDKEEDVNSHYQRRQSLSGAISSIQGRAVRQRPDGEETVYLVSSGTKEGLKTDILRRLTGSSRVKVGDRVRQRFVERMSKLVSSAGEQVLRYNSIQLLCSSLSELFECKIDAKVTESDEEGGALQVNEPTNTKILLWDETQGRKIALQWKVLGGKYGSVTFAGVLVPKVTNEYLLRSQVVASSCNMPLKIKNLRAWFHGSQYIEPGWVPENVRLFLAIKSPLKGVHSTEGEIWERENIVSLLLARENFSMVVTKDGTLRRYQVSPSIVTFHNNVRDSSRWPPHFFIQGSKKSLIKLNDAYRPLFSNYLFMEYIDGFPLETLLYYIRSEDVYSWLSQGDSQKRKWLLWLEAILNLSRVIILSAQSLSSTGFFQYLHCDLNFGNIIILKEKTDELSSSPGRLFGDKNNHLENLRFVAGIGQDSIRIIDFSFASVLHHREREDEVSDLDEFLRSKGAHRVVGERNFENACKKMIKAALFNDPNYVSILVSELLLGHSSLLNKSLLYKDQKDYSPSHFFGDLTENPHLPDPSLKWKDTSNQFINLLFRLNSSLNSVKEWELVAQEFVEDENPIRRWISKEGKSRNQRNVLSSFNQGAEAYMVACDKFNQIIQVAQKTGLIAAQGGGASLPLGGGNCLSFEFYLRSYLFLPYNIAKAGSCLYSKAKKSPVFASYIRSEQSNTTRTFFQVASITLSYYIWTKDRSSPNHTTHTSPTLRDFFTEIQQECNLEKFDPEKSESLHNLQNIDPKLERTKHVYLQIYRNQQEFLDDNITNNKLGVPFVLLLQRTWYRIQESTEILRKKLPLNTNQNVLNSLIAFFKSLETSTLKSTQQRELHLHLTDSKILNACLEINNIQPPIFQNSVISPSDLCKLIIKPLPHTTPFSNI